MNRIIIFQESQKFNGWSALKPIALTIPFINKIQDIQDILEIIWYILLGYCLKIKALRPSY